MKLLYLKWKLKAFFLSFIPKKEYYFYVGLPLEMLDNQWHTVSVSLDALKGEPEYTRGWPRTFFVFKVKGEIIPK